MRTIEAIAVIIVKEGKSFATILLFCIIASALHSSPAEAQDIPDSLRTEVFVDTLSAADSIALDAQLTADNIIVEALKYLGTPYRSAGKGPGGFDCSGFTGFIFRQFGYNLSSSSRTQCDDGRSVPPPFDKLQKGDLLLFGARGSVGEVGHVGIYIAPDAEGDGFTFIHATVHGGIIISNIKEDYYSRRYLGARRILPDFTVPKDPVESGPFE